MIFNPRLLYLTLSSLLLPGLCSAADLQGTADDGRKILLKDDGSWEYQSSDRFAISEDGSRVRLKADGSWEFVGNAPLVKKQQVRTRQLDVQLAEVVTEYNKRKVGKNTRYQSQTIFYLDVDVSRYSEDLAVKLSHHNLIKASDSRGNNYPVLSISPAPKQLRAGKRYQLTIRTDGSPSGQFAVGIKYLYLNIDKAVFSTDTDLRFSKRADELTKKKL